MIKLCQFYGRLLHAKAFSEKGADYFFEFCFPKSVFWNVIFGRISQKAVQLIFWYLFAENLFFEKKTFLIYGRFQRSHFLAQFPQNRECA